MNAKSCVEFVLQAMNNVDDEYLNVEIAVDYVGHKEIKRRERVYAYELYHQMRLIQEQKFKSEFTINGEIDKSGHKIIKEPFNPDFVIHQQGKMGENFCVVELKTINKKSGIQKDFHTITCMMHCYRYKIGIFAMDVLLSSSRAATEKKKILEEEFGVAMNEELEREVLVMCNLSQGVKAEGISIGEMRMLVQLVRDGDLKMERAAEKAKMTVEQFKKVMENTPLQAV